MQRFDTSKNSRMNGQDWNVGRNSDDENQSDEINPLLKSNCNSDDEVVNQSSDASVSRAWYATAIWIGTATVLLAAVIAAVAGLRNVLPHSLPFFASENENHDLFSSNVFIEKIRLDLAALSIEMMQNDTLQAATESNVVDIGPFCDLIDKALDDIGIRGVYIELFETRHFLGALRTAAVAKGLHDFYTRLDTEPGHQPAVHYWGIPNDRESFVPGDDSSLCHGCIWWLRHYVGSVTADKLLREGSLLLTNSTGERVYSASSVVRELHRIQRMEYTDIVSFHAEHGFIWRHVTVTMPMLDTYPLQLANDFCGDLLPTDEEMILGTSVARECWHGFGHATFHVLAMRELGGEENYDWRKTLRPSGGFILSEESMCEGYRICYEAPSDRHALRECVGGFRHSALLYRSEKMLDMDLSKDIQQQFERCMDN